MTADGVLITGVYGSGKSTVAAEIADQLEAAGARYAALDLDWLGWYDAGGDDGEGFRMLLRNLAAVVGNYLAAGVERFVLAHAVRSAPELASIAGSVPFPLRTVRLTVSLETITDRLGEHLTTGREQDLRNASHWLAEGIGAGLEDIVVDNGGPVRDVGREIVRWLGWLD